MLNFTNAITCRPAETFANGLTSGEGNPDFALAEIQHEAYVDALRATGLEVLVIQSNPKFPDSTFVEDTAVLTPRVRIITRPGAPQRLGEVDSIRAVLDDALPVREIKAPGILDGGDVCQIESLFLIGISARTSEDGARQLSEILQSYGYASAAVEIRQFSSLLHLKSGISYLGQGRILAVPEIASHPLFAQMKVFHTQAGEDYAANAVRINDKLLFPKGYQRLENELELAGFDLVILDVSEFKKMDGGLSCLSLRW